MKKTISNLVSFERCLCKFLVPNDYSKQNTHGGRFRVRVQGSARKKGNVSNFFFFRTLYSPITDFVRKNATEKKLFARIWYFFYCNTFL